MRSRWIVAVLGIAACSSRAGNTPRDGGSPPDKATVFDSGTASDLSTAPDLGTVVDGAMPLDLSAVSDGDAPSDSAAPPDSGAMADGGGDGSAAPTSYVPPNSCDNVSPSGVATNLWTSDPNFCFIHFAYNLPKVRQLAVAENGDLFAGGNGQVRVIWDADGDGVAMLPSERSVFATIEGGTHGVAVTKTHVYASSPGTVLRWTYAPGQRTASGPPETVVHGMIVGGAHFARELVIDEQNRLYVSIGSISNTDAPPTPDDPPKSWALIRRYDLTQIPAGGYAADDGELVAKGLRNESGMTIDSDGNLWGVENGRDNLRSGTGEDIHLDNPAEEVHRFDLDHLGRNYGFPFCYTEGVLTGPEAKGRGTQHLDAEYAAMWPNNYTETRCQDPDQVVPPVFALRAHLAPIGIVQIRGTAYPPEYAGDFIVTSHGSWNHAPNQVGQLLIRLRLGGPKEGEVFAGKPNPENGKWSEGMWQVRPTGITLDKQGLITFSDDGLGFIFKLGYRPPNGGG